MTFLQKSYGEYSKVEKPVLVRVSYEGWDDEEELETVPIIGENNNNNNNNLVSDSDSDNNNDSNNENNIGKNIDHEVKATPKTTINTKLI